ncbi:hypothetical protein [Veillonella intestinalis]|uniref:hypothetical protein n=1 Tax=Veillonella intestinalis TaxID=2941341 RepID=UPI00203CAAC9|nr:hypothetical protein [Veillonella intestinalis]
MSNQQDKFKGKTFLLMHKDIPTVKFHFYKYEMWANVDEVLDKHHAPVNMVGHHKGVDFYLNKFLNHHVIPKDRPNVADILERKIPNLVNTLQKRVNSLEKELTKRNLVAHFS